MTLHHSHQTISLINDLMLKLFENNRYIERDLIKNLLAAVTYAFKEKISIVHLPFLECHPHDRYYGQSEDEAGEKLKNFTFWIGAKM